MAKSNYTPNDHRSISMNPNNAAYYGSRSIPVPPHVAGQDSQPIVADTQDSKSDGDQATQKPRD